MADETDVAPIPSSILYLLSSLRL